MSDHTPGPWKDTITDEGDLIVQIGEPVENPTTDMATTHGVFLGDMEGTCGECHANARLIAMAPDLLALASRLREALNDRVDVADMSFFAILDDADLIIKLAKDWTTERPGIGHQ